MYQLIPIDKKEEVVFLPQPQRQLQNLNNHAWKSHIHHLSKKKFLNAQKLVENFEKLGFPIDSAGNLKAEEFFNSVFVIPYLVYCVTGKNKPLKKNWKPFLHFLSRLKLDYTLLSPRVREEVKKASKNEKKKKQSKK